MMSSWTSSSSLRGNHTPRAAVIGGVLALPWCCLVPAGLSFLGLTSAGFVRAAIVPVRPYLLTVAVGLMGWAHYLVWVRRQGTRWSRWVVVGTTLVAAGTWLWPWLVL